MPSSNVFPLSLDAKTKKIIRQIPRGFKSQKIREWILEGAKGEDFDVTASRTRKKESMKDILRNL